MQAAAAGRVRERYQNRIRHLHATIEETGRATIVELRRLLTCSEPTRRPGLDGRGITGSRTSPGFWTSCARQDWISARRASLSGARERDVGAAMLHCHTRARKDDHRMRARASARPSLG